MLKIGSYISSANMYLCNPHTNAIAAAWKAGRIIKYERAAASVAGRRADISPVSSQSGARTLSNSVQYFKRQDWAISSAQWSFFIAYHRRVISIMDGKIFRRCSASIAFHPAGPGIQIAAQQRCMQMWNDLNEITFLMHEQSQTCKMGSRREILSSHISQIKQFVSFPLCG